MTSEMSYSSIKMSHHIRENEERKAIEKKRQLLYLILQHLKEEGYFETVRSLCSEAQLSNQYDICDNIDLGNIIQEYEAYYFLRFQKYPKIYKKISMPSEDKNSNVAPISKKKYLPKKLLLQETANITECEKKNSVVTQKDLKQNNSKLCKSSSNNNNIPSSFKNNFSLDLTVLPLLSNSNQNVLSTNNSGDSEDNFTYDRLLKPLCGFSGFCSEWKEFAEAISKEICMTNLNVHWDDIMGLEEAKRLLKEAVVYPVKYPELFSGVLAPWKGKTLLAKAVATKCKTTFFNISASSIVSKWRGDSEKLVRVLFELARYHAPSTIFLDELDALASHRDGLMEHEGSRRLKTELLIQLDGLSQSDDRVFLLATSNLPWELDAAILRRLEKRILVDLPIVEARHAMLKHYLPPTIISEPTLSCNLDYQILAEATVGYSGSDIKLVCKEAAMDAMRQVFSVLEAHDNRASLSSLKLKTITTQDLQQALKRTKPSAAHLVGKYQKWQKEFGSI